MRKVTPKQILEELKSMKPARSQWGRAVHDDAVAILGMIVDDGRNYELQSSKQLESLMLSGAENWKEYSYGCHGCSLPSDVEIAKHYSNNTELKMTNFGLKKPNSRETWMDVQARGLYQSCYLAKEIYYKLAE